MSATGRKKNVRPLGSVRVPIQPSFDRTNHFSQYSKNINTNRGGSIDYEIHGNAMQVPPPKEEKEKEEPPKLPVKPVIKSAKSDSGSGSSAKSQENLVDKKELNEAKQITFTYHYSIKTKIKELKQQLAALEQEVADLRDKVDQRDKLIAELRAELAKQEEQYKRLYEKERTSHGRTAAKLSAAEDEIMELLAQLKKLRKEMEEKIQIMQLEHEKRLAEVTEEKDKVIADRDAKLNRLKQQMAESLKGNSWERQQQLEELTKELGRIQDEADNLRIKLKQYKGSKTCPNCQDAAQKVEKAVAIVKERDFSIKELKELCSRFEKQLTQQDELLKVFAEKKGHKVTNFPK